MIRSYLHPRPHLESEPFPLSAQLEILYREREIELSHQTKLRARESVLRKTLKKHLRRMAGLSHDLEQATKYEPYARYGELLKANLGSLKKGLTTVTVVDYYDVTLPN